MFAVSRYYAFSGVVGSYDYQPEIPEVSSRGGGEGGDEGVVELCHLGRD